MISAAAAATVVPEAANAAAAPATLPSSAMRFEDFKVKQNRTNRSRDVFDGLTHSGYRVDMHLTELSPGEMPHAAHQHAHEELVMLREGTLEVTISGKVTVVGPGSVVYVASNEMHGWKNAGDKPAHYFVMALGRPVPAAG